METGPHSRVPQETGQKPSCHPSNIHAVWPLARFSAFNSRCSSNALAREAKLFFLAKLLAHHPKHVAAQQLVKHVSDRRRIFDSHSIAKPRNSWLVLPFHPSLGGMSKVLSRLDVHWSYVRGGSFSMFRPRLSWRIDHPSLASILSKDSRRKIDVYRKGVGG